MVIECSSCQARFKLADDKIKESGTKVRCTKCREVFTVFPETPPQVTQTVIAPPPVVAVEKEVISDDFFSVTDKVPLVPAIPPPAVDVPVSTTDDWEQEAQSDFFATDAGATDLDAINFDNFETPAFSVGTETASKFEFSDDSAFSFDDSSFEIGVGQPHKDTAQTDDKFFSAESENDFEADFSSPPLSSSSPEELSSSSSIATDSDFTFSETENLADFSWGEADIVPSQPVVSEATQAKQSAPQDSAFDFGSFSFDEAPETEAGGLEESQRAVSIDTVTNDKPAFDLSMDTESPVAPVLVRPAPPDEPQAAESSSAVTKDHESTSPSARPLRLRRPRSRQTRKSSTRLLVKILFAIFLALSLVYGVINRVQLQRDYKELIDGFIEKQVPVEASGQIALTKLTGYLLKSQEGDLFVIRGEAINEFKGLRSSILVKGTLLGENGEALQGQSAYCGNSLKDDSLKKIGFKKIREAMNNELGINLINLNIAAGKAIPFMIVFDKAPKNIKEFTVEVVDSKTGSK